MGADGAGDGATAGLSRPAGRRNFWGWGLEGAGLAVSEVEQLGAIFADRLGLTDLRLQEPPRLEELELRAPRVAPPASLETVFSTGPYDRAAHTYGRSFRDLVRAFRRDYAHAPDLVAFPRDEGELVSVLDWCGDAGVAAIPFGGGSSVVGGVEPDVGDGYRGAVSVDLRNLDGVLEVDRTSLAARIAAWHARSGAGSPAEAARAHVAAFPAVIRVVDAGRLDRDALRRPLRDAAHPYR